MPPFPGRPPRRPPYAPEKGPNPALPNSALAAMNVDHEVNLLVEEIHRLGSKNADGKLSVKFGVLFQDDKCANLFEALVGTLKAAKRRKIIMYPGELLLQGVHDDVDIVLLQD
ncbi:costars family protein ABRACL isoform X1 [Camelus dromedarius]|uniref:costars family protein ABRACL isoform X1 n=1 Tax=Camelus dromedarius TaxID=9838 RepID=UPI0012631685|nr:costars family protein ABRACL isoform X1 [Camelus dromedarius]